MTEAETETFEGYLVLDWRSGEQRQENPSPRTSRHIRSRFPTRSMLRCLR